MALTTWRMVLIGLTTLLWLKSEIRSAPDSVSFVNGIVSSVWSHVTTPREKSENSEKILRILFEEKRVVVPVFVVASALTLVVPNLYLPSLASTKALCPPLICLNFNPIAFFTVISSSPFTLKLCGNSSVGAWRPELGSNRHTRLAFSSVQSSSPCHPTTTPQRKQSFRTKTKD